MAFARRAAMSDDDLGLPDPDAWKREPMRLEDIRKDPRHLRDKATLDFETGEIKPATDLFDWAQWLDNTSRHVAYDQVSGFVVSTVFLGINQNFFGKGEPIWFETMVFREGADGELKGREDVEQLRYSTIEEARAGHAKVVEAVQKGEIGE
jgi:hypothetical protein